MNMKTVTGRFIESGTEFAFKTKNSINEGDVLHIPKYSGPFEITEIFPEEYNFVHPMTGDLKIKKNSTKDIPIKELVLSSEPLVDNEKVFFNYKCEFNPRAQMRIVNDHLKPNLQPYKRILKEELNSYSIREPSNFYSAWLVKFMELKNNIIKSVSTVKYLMAEDIAAIKNWPEEECKKVYDRLYHNIFIENAAGLKNNTCVFCIRHKLPLLFDCDSCEYGKIHGICGERFYKPKSDFNRIIDDFRKKGEYVYQILSNNAYKKIWYDSFE